jgi:ABC-type nitrate/sulfonate/bicarbonate transport system substrate-binding protein
MTNTTGLQISRRTFVALGAGAIMSPALSRGAAAQTPPAQLTIGVLRAPTSGIIAVSDQKGWFKDAGLALSTELFAAAAGPKIIQALGSGSVGLSFVNSTAALLALAGGAVPLRMISIPTDPSRLFALLSTSAIESVPKLAGKRVAVTAGTALHYFLARVLAKHDMSLKDIEFVNLPAAEGQAAFVAGRVDALVPSVTGRFFVMSTKNDARELFTHADFERGQGPTTPFVNYDLFVTTESALQANRDGLRRFLSVYHDKGVDYLLSPATKNEATAAITEYVNNEQKSPTDTAIMNRLLGESTFYRSKEAKQVISSPAFVESLEYQLKFFRDIGQIKNTPAVREAVVDDLL